LLLLALLLCCSLLGIDPYANKTATTDGTEQQTVQVPDVFHVHLRLFKRNLKGGNRFSEKIARKFKR